MSQKFRSVRQRLERTFRGSLTAAGQVRNTFEAEVGHDVELEKILAPSFWWSVHGQLRPFDKIEVQWEDGSRVVMLRVMGMDDRSETVLVVPLWEQKFNKLPGELPPGYSISFVSKGTGWRIFRDGASQPVRSGFATELEAYIWLAGDVSPPGDDAEADAGDDDKGGPNTGGGNRRRTKPAEAVTS